MSKLRVIVVLAILSPVFLAYAAALLTHALAGLAVLAGLHVAFAGVRGWVWAGEQLGLPTRETLQRTMREKAMRLGFSTSSTPSPSSSCATPGCCDRSRR